MAYTRELPESIQLLGHDATRFSTNASRMISHPQRRFRLSLLALLSVTTWGALRADQVDDVVTFEMTQHHITGLAIAVIDGGSLVREQGYGSRDKTGREPVTPSTLFQAASISKPVAALGALHLVDQGKLFLDEDVNLKLRAWSVPQNRFTKQRAVTLREILCHSAGINLGGPPGYDMDASIPTFSQVLRGTPPANTPPIRVTQVPGRWRYSGGGYLVLEQLITDTAGMSFAEYIKKTVLSPLGMTSSTYDQPSRNSSVDRAANGYSGLFGRSIKGRWRVHPELAAAGLWSTPGDLARFAIGVQRSYLGDGNQIISRSTTRLMLTETQNNDGLGLFVKGSGKKLLFWHEGRNVGFDSIMIAYAATGQGAVIMLNTNVGPDTLKKILHSIADQYDWPQPRAAYFQRSNNHANSFALHS
jgi:CubicO group peptidase (beta-lactamase class C family)